MYNIVYTMFVFIYMYYEIRTKKRNGLLIQTIFYDNYRSDSKIKKNIPNSNCYLFNC